VLGGGYASAPTSAADAADDPKSPSEGKKVLNSAEFFALLYLPKILPNAGLAVEEELAIIAARGGADIPNLPRVGSGLKVDFVKPVRDTAGNIAKEFPTKPMAHGFPDVIDNFAISASSFELRNGAILYQVEGSLNGVTGRFEWIVDRGAVTHRMFVGGGTVNSVPIVP
jgi:hypothetical protein